MNEHNCISYCDYHMGINGVMCCRYDPKKRPVKKIKKCPLDKKGTSK